MQFYSFKLDEESSWLCIIIMLLGKYCYLCIPMGIHNNPDFAQQIMKDILHDSLKWAAKFT
jgi:hypothetical protein